MIDNFITAVQDVCEVLMFENWMRFYFIQENEKKELIIHIPEAGMKRIEEAHPNLFPLAENLNDEVITADSSRQAICTTLPPIWMVLNLKMVLPPLFLIAQLSKLNASF